VAENISNVPEGCIRIVTWNIGTMSGTSHRRKIYVVLCTRNQTGSGARHKGIFGYKFYWQGCKDDTAVVGFLISGRWIDRDVDVKMVNECVMCLKVLIGDKLMICICVNTRRKWIQMQRRKTVSGIRCSV